MTDAQLVAVCQVICAIIPESRPLELWTQNGPTPLAERLLLTNTWRNSERVLFQLAWAMWNANASTLTFGQLLGSLHGEHLEFVGSLLVAIGQGSEAVSRWLKAQGVDHVR